MKNNSELVERLSQELEDLTTKVSKLIAFIESDGFGMVNPRMQELLRSQFDAMHVYKNILQTRIELLHEEEIEIKEVGVVFAEDVAELEAKCAELTAAAKDVITRWDSPLWKMEEHTAEFINRLREAVAKCEETP